LTVLVVANREHRGVAEPLVRERYQRRVLGERRRRQQGGEQQASGRKAFHGINSNRTRSCDRRKGGKFLYNYTYLRKFNQSQVGPKLNEVARIPGHSVQPG
jgi:hypothetical protein